MRKHRVSSFLLMTMGVLAQGFADAEQQTLIASSSFFGGKSPHVAASLTNLFNSSSSSPSKAEGQEQNVLGNWQGASGRASVQEGLTIDASLLYLLAKEDNLLYAETIDLSLPQTSPGTIYAKGKQRQLDFEWAPGVQVNLGYIFPSRQQLELFFSWNYLHSQARDSDDTSPFDPTAKFIKPYLASYITGADAQRCSGHWILNYNTLDMMFSRNFFAGKYLAIKPMLGARGAWIDQKFSAKYEGIHIGNSTFIFDSFFKNATSFMGGGIRIGTDLQWFLSSEWSILGSFSGSLLYGYFKVHERIKGAILTDPNTVFPAFIKLYDNQSRISPNLEGKLGLQWQLFFGDGDFKFALGAFYTLIYWFNQNKLLNAASSFSFNSMATNTTPTPQVGNLQMQGGMLEVRFEF